MILLQRTSQNSDELVKFSKNFISLQIHFLHTRNAEISYVFNHGINYLSKRILLSEINR